MANRGRATFAKRQKEIARQERAREKAAKRVERKETSVRSTARVRGGSRHRRHRARDPSRCPTTCSTKKIAAAEDEPAAEQEATQP